MGSIRFAKCNQCYFESSDSIESVISNLHPDDPTAFSNYRKAMTDVYQKFTTELGLKYNNRKDPDLFNFIQRHHQEQILKRRFLHSEDLVTEFGSLLPFIDYEEPVTKFRTEFVESKQAAKALLIPVGKDDESVLQKLLIFRLFQSLRYLENPPRIYEVPIPSQWGNAPSLDDFCQLFSDRLGLESVNSFAELVKRFEKLSRTQPIVITLFDIQNMGEYILDFLKDFCCQIVMELNQDLQVTEDFRLLIFCASEGDVFGELQHEIEADSWGNFVRLKKVDKILSSDVGKWIDWSAYSIKQRCMKVQPEFNCSMINSWELSSDVPIGWNPLIGMRKISEAFGFSKDLGQFTHCWKLSGDQRK